MSKKFIIEDRLHAEWQGEFDTFEAALADLQKRKNIPWNEKPNKAPCTAWKTCGREYEINEFDTEVIPWKLINTTMVLNISAEETKWLSDKIQ